MTGRLVSRTIALESVPIISHQAMIWGHIISSRLIMSSDPRRHMELRDPLCFELHISDMFLDVYGAVVVHYVQIPALAVFVRGSYDSADNIHV